MIAPVLGLSPIVLGVISVTAALLALALGRQGQPGLRPVVVPVRSRFQRKPDRH